jgi:hypothetical protein
LILSYTETSHIPLKQFPILKRIPVCGTTHIVKAIIICSFTPDAFDAVQSGVSESVMDSGSLESSPPDMVIISGMLLIENAGLAGVLYFGSHTAAADGLRQSWLLRAQGDMAWRRDMLRPMIRESAPFGWG